MLSGIRWTGIEVFSNVILNATQIILLARWLDQEDFAVLASALLVFGVGLIFCSTAFAESIIAKKNFLSAEKKPLNLLQISISLTVFLVIFFSSDLISKFFQLGSENYFKLLGLTLFIIGVTTQIETLLRKDLQFESLAKYKIVSNLFGVSSSIAIAFIYKDPWAFIIGISLNHLMKSALLLINHHHLFKIGFKYEFKKISGHIHFSTYRMFTSAINQVTSRIEQIIITYFLGPIYLGIYTLGLQFIMQPYSKINPIISQISLPIFSKHKSDEELKHKYLLTHKFINLINIPLLILIAFCAQDFVVLFFGSKWLSSVSIIQILCFYVVIRSAGNLNVTLLVAKSNFKSPFYWNIAMLFITPLFITLFYIISPSLESICFSLLYLEVAKFFAFYFLYVKKIVNNALFKICLNILIPLLFSAISIIVLYSALPFLEDMLIVVRLAINILIGLSVFMLLLYFFNSNDLKQMLSIIYKK